MYKLVLIGHGESVWNKENKYTGWTDVDLSEKGTQEAIKAGQDLKKEGFSFDLAYTSVLKRAIKTLNNVFHIYNPNHVSMNKMIDYLKTRNIDIEIVSKEEFKEVFKHCLKNNYEMVEGIVTDINDNFEIEYVDNIKIKNDKTIKILQNLNYKWPNIDEVYLNKFISYLIDIGFLNIGGDK